MDSSYINEEAVISTSVDCIHDSSIGFQSDFTSNGEVDGWEYYDGIHSYGCWDGFLFGTIYGRETSPVYGTIGRFNVFLPVNATTHYHLRIVMKYSPYERDSRGIHPLPTRSKVRWRTLANANFDADKERYFTLYPDGKWHTYILNMGVEQFWQGDVNDLRIWPVTENAEDGDEFFIRAIDIFSIESHACNNTRCDKYFQYSHPCPWIGKRSTMESDPHFEDIRFNVSDGSEFIININGYGNEIVKFTEIANASGQEMANILAKNISQTDIGGYAEVYIEYTDDNVFKIYTGTANSGSSISIIDNDFSRYLKFYDSIGKDVSATTDGEDPATGYSPLSSFKIKTHQLYGLLDGNEKTGLIFNPFNYSVEGGRRDWLASSMGIPTESIGGIKGDIGGQTIRNYYRIPNSGKTAIDYNHPFNASGRITKIYVQATLDDDYDRNPSETIRKTQELSGGKVLIVRPRRDGTMSVIYSWDIPDRQLNRGVGDPLYSVTQESIEFDVDVFVNKGDLIAVYNAHMYIGKSLSGNEYDCRFYQPSGLVSGDFDPGTLYGDGMSGLLVYARGEDTQRRLYIELDLKNRYNIDNINVYAEAKNAVLEYNLARCLDINWKVDLFGLYHWTHHKKITAPGDWHYGRPNTYYGLENLSDGVYTAPAGLACDDFSRTFNNATPQNNPEAGPGIIPVNPKYFWINGDEEWLAVWLHNSWFQYEQTVSDFSEDPIAIYVYFPLQKTKKIYKSKIYFKEKSNFRSFALSTYGGVYYTLGDADDYHYDYIPEYKQVSLDSRVYTQENAELRGVDKYLFVNPSVGKAITKQTTRDVYEWDPIYSDLIEDFGGYYGDTHGYFVSSYGIVTNDEQFEQARNVNWNILEHQWEPIEAQGFRIYTDFHQSTKILEMEIYGVSEDVGSTLGGSLVVTHSDYGEVWWPTEINQISEELVNVYVGDSPRYINFEIIPITETRYDDIIVSVKTEDLYAGTKGCQYINLIENSKSSSENDSQVMNVKNIYGNEYDLYVDIRKNVLFGSGVTYYSKINNALSISNPEIGPDGRYYKQFDYPIRNREGNVAINCDVYGLKNLIDGAKAYYSYDDMSNWIEWGELSHGQSINFENLINITKTVIVLPDRLLSRYWKFGLLDPDVSFNIRDMKVFDSDNNEMFPAYYHDLDKSFLEGGVNYRAPHISNESVTGSYYTLYGDQYVTMDFGELTQPYKLIMYNDSVDDYVNFTRTVDPISGIDRYTKMCLRAWKDNTGGYLNDVSYYAHEVTMHGTAHVDVGQDDSDISLDVDMGCNTDILEWQSANYNYAKDLTPDGYWFTPISASGTVTSGICEYPGYVGFNVKCHDHGNNRFYYDMREDSAEAYKLYQQVPFEITFTIELNGYYPGGIDGEGETNLDYQPALSVGALSTRRRITSNFLGGVQMWFAPPSNPGSNGTFPGRFGLAVRRNTAFNIGYYAVTGPNTYTSTYANGLTLDTKYYCKLTCYGSDTHRDTDEVSYRAQVWLADEYAPIYETEKINIESMTHDESRTFQGPPSNVSDGSESSYWQLFGGIVTNQWVSVDLELDTVIYKVLIEGINGASERTPQNFRIEASDNNSDWDIIHTDITVQNSDPQEFVFSTPSSAYRYWRIYMIDSYSASYLTLTRFELYAVTPAGDPVADLTRTTNIYWEANDLAVVGSALNPTQSSSPGPGNYYGCGSISGTVYDLKLNVDHDVASHPFVEANTISHEQASIRIPAGIDNYVQVKNSVNLDVGIRYHTHDFWVKFRTLPLPGERWTIIEQIGASILEDAWRLALYCAGDGSYYRWEWWINKNGTWSLIEYNGKTGYSLYCSHFNIVKDKWYFMVFSTGKQYSTRQYTAGPGGFDYKSFLDINGRAAYDDNYPGNPSAMYDMPAGQDIYIGKDGFDGWIAEPRLSRAETDDVTDDEHGGHRYIYSVADLSYNDVWYVPIKPYRKLYTFSFYVSGDNASYGLYGNIDTFLGPPTETYLPALDYDELSSFAQTYNAYFAIDFDHRYDLDLVRRYGAEDDYYIDRNSNVIYSLVDDDDVSVAILTPPDFDPDDSFDGYNEYLSRDRWYFGDDIIGNESVYLIMKDGRLESKVDSTITNLRWYTTYGIRGGFDIQVKCGKISASNRDWHATFRVDFSDGASGATAVDVRMEHRSSGYRVVVYFYSNSNTSFLSAAASLSSPDTGIRIVRKRNTFYTFYFEDGVWKSLKNIDVANAKGKDAYRIQFGLQTSGTIVTAKTYWSDFRINSATDIVMRSQPSDARWIIIEMLNGDNTNRYLNKIGVYPDVNRGLSPDISKYNTDWINLGPSVTNYNEGLNVALNTTVVGSSIIEGHPFNNVVNGIIVDDRASSWLSDNGSEQWFLIDFAEVKNIYRVKIYHGIDTEKYPDYYAEDYRIEISDDNQSFTTIFTIANNSSYERTHDLAEPVSTRYVRIYITDYHIAQTPIRLQDADTLQFINWNGTGFREIEVYESAGFSYITSENYPIIAVNLKDHFYIGGKTLVGPYAESTDYDWSSDDSNFTWSNSDIGNPDQVDFRGYGGAPYHDKWLAIKRDTATYHNEDPVGVGGNPAAGLGVDYLKYVRVQATTEENPINYPWWWSSNISTLSRDYDKEVQLCVNSLRIDYPASAALDVVQFIEGDDWGIDSDIAYRDGLSFRWYIEDIDKLDTSEGYVFFGGSDGSKASQPVIYYWNLSTFSGTLNTGWNVPFFRFKSADYVIENENIDRTELRDPRMREYTTWHTAGIGFRGFGQPFYMNIDGMVIKRNHFDDGSRFDAGLYLSGKDYLDVPLGAIDFNAGAIEFWMRPDFNDNGGDEFQRYWNRGLFSFGNVANDVFGAVIGAAGFNIYSGNVENVMNVLNITKTNIIERDGLYHIAVVYSNNGKNISSDGSTIRVYINGILTASSNQTWEVRDTKMFKFTMGGKPPLGVIQQTGSIRVGGCDSVISNLRLYNYCKIDYKDSIVGSWSSLSSNRLLTSAEMIEISDDNVTFYKVDAAELPFYFEKVQPDGTVPIYVRSIVPKGLTGSEKRTAGIVTIWDIGI